VRVPTPRRRTCTCARAPRPPASPPGAVRACACACGPCGARSDVMHAPRTDVIAGRSHASRMHAWRIPLSSSASVPSYHTPASFGARHLARNITESIEQFGTRHLEFGSRQFSGIIYYNMLVTRQNSELKGSRRRCQDDDMMRVARTVACVHAHAPTRIRTRAEH